MSDIIFFVQGIPKSQPRPRAFAMKFGNKYQARVYDSGTSEGWKSCIALAARPFIPKKPYDGPICLNLVFNMPRPKNHYGTGKNAGVLKKDSPLWFTKKPDKDNLEKAVMDTLTQVGMWVDDSQVCDGRCTKFYAKENKTGVRIEIKTIEEAS